MAEEPHGTLIKIPKIMSRSHVQEYRSMSKCFTPINTDLQIHIRILQMKGYTLNVCPRFDTGGVTALLDV